MSLLAVSLRGPIVSVSRKHAFSCQRMYAEKSISTWCHWATKNLAGLRNLSRIPSLTKQPSFNTVQVRRNLSSRKPLHFEVDTNVAKDTLIFSYENDQLFRMANLFGLAQWLFWFNLAFNISPAPGMTLEEIESKRNLNTLTRTILKAQIQNQGAIATGCFIMGTAITSLCFLYPLRTVRSLHLLKGGRNVSMETYSFFGNTRKFTVPLSHVGCLHLREQTKSQLSLKLKNTYLFYLVNCKGTFHEPKLWDYAIGVKRSLK